MTEGTVTEIRNPVKRKSRATEVRTFADVGREPLSGGLVVDNTRTEIEVKLKLRHTETPQYASIRHQELHGGKASTDTSPVKEDLQKDHLQAMTEHTVSEVYDEFKQQITNFNPRIYGAMERLFEAYQNLEKIVAIHKSTTFSELGSKSWILFKALGFMTICVARSLHNTFRSRISGIPEFDGDLPIKHLTQPFILCDSGSNEEKRTGRSYSK